MSIVAFVPLRGPQGGTRLGGGKEARILGRYPLLAYTIRAAVDSGVFDSVQAVVADEQYAAMAENYGAQVIFKRPAYTTRDGSPDIEWVLFMLKKLEEYHEYSAFSILRVTSPFRGAGHIKDAWKKFRLAVGADSLRAVRRVSEDPCKMWVIRQDRLLPLFPIGEERAPWHSRASQENFASYVQTAGLEFAWTDRVLETKTIAGSVTVPFVLEDPAAIDINTPLDWQRAEAALEKDPTLAPESLR